MLNSIKDIQIVINTKEGTNSITTNKIKGELRAIFIRYQSQDSL